VNNRLVLAIAGIVLVVGVGVVAQQAQHAPSATKHAPWTPPVTPWGEPDLQGYYTNKYEYGTPFERPAEFEGRQLDDVTPAELAAVMKKRQQEAIDRAPGP
jgi:hypothetical protein